MLQRSQLERPEVGYWVLSGPSRHAVSKRDDRTGSDKTRPGNDISHVDPVCERARRRSLPRTTVRRQEALSRGSQSHAATSSVSYSARNFSSPTLSSSPGKKGDSTTR